MAGEDVLVEASEGSVKVSGEEKNGSASGIGESHGGVRMLR